MKYLVVILFLTIYGNAVFGAVINLHFCGERLVKVSVLNFSPTGGCACDPDNEPMDCCKNVLLYQKSDTHKTPQSVFPPKIARFFIASPTEVIIQIPVTISKCPEIITHFRRSTIEPIYLLNSVFRI